MNHRTAGRASWTILAGALLAACTHSDSYTFTSPVLGPSSTGPDVQLTYNVDQDYWPTWTQDGKGILYAYVDLAAPAHRCVGLLPASGGTRIWSLCDNRAVRRDSINSYSAFALDSTGRMLLAEAVSTSAFDFPLHPQLTLFDTATPYVRTTLLTLPITVGGVVVTWLSELRWTGPSSFVALGQQFGSMAHCYLCRCSPCPTDSSFEGNGIILTGTLRDGVASVRAIDGTQGASGYDLPGDGASVYFVRHLDGRLFRVSATGGNPVPIATIAPNVAFSLLGVSCRADTCIVADAPVNDAGDFVLLTGMRSTLVRVTPSTADTAMAGQFDGIVATPVFSPRSGDLVVETGPIVGPSLDDATAPVLGHLATFAAASSNLHLLRNLVP